MPIAHTEYRTKREARQAVEELGFVHCGTGQSRDYVYGSREYFERLNDDKSTDIA